MTTIDHVIQLLADLSFKSKITVLYLILQSILHFEGHLLPAQSCHTAVRATAALQAT